MLIDARLPTGDVSHGSGYTTVGSGNYLYERVDDAVGSPDDDTSYICWGEPSWNDDLVFSKNAFSVPSGATNISLKLYLRTKVAACSGEWVRPLLQIGGTTYYGSQQDNTQSNWTTYSQTWAINPSTGSNWTVSEINGTIDFGLQLHVGFQPPDPKFGGGCLGTNFITQIYLEVSYTASPTVTTNDASSVGTTTATGGGNVIADGGATITERGICWSTSANPTTSNSKTTASGTTGTFTANMTGLNANTTYHVRAYAINSVGTSYGSDKSFTTQSESTGKAFAVAGIGIVIGGPSVSVG
jgi:hypothetical protein